MIGHNDPSSTMFNCKSSCVAYVSCVRSLQKLMWKWGCISEVWKSETEHLLSSAVTTPFTNIGNEVIVCSHLTSCIVHHQLSVFYCHIEHWNPCRIRRVCFYVFKDFIATMLKARLWNSRSYGSVQMIPSKKECDQLDQQRKKQGQNHLSDTSENNFVRRPEKRYILTALCQAPFSYNLVHRAKIQCFKVFQHQMWR
jgi:hypothetical protein